jgi:hypothetical protein
MEKIDTAIEMIIRLRKEQEQWDNCLAEALRFIPEKYAKILLDKYSDLCCGVNHG